MQTTDLNELLEETSPPLLRAAAMIGQPSNYDGLRDDDIVPLEIEITIGDVRRIQDAASKLKEAGYNAL